MNRLRPRYSRATNRRISILGTRGVPASHGGFETFVQRLAPYLADRGWEVTVHCHGGSNSHMWNGVRLQHHDAPGGPLGTLIFDAKATWAAYRSGGLHLVFGYNTAIFCILLNVAGQPYIMNMDGVEWQRRKWNRVAKLWFWLNERIACAIAPSLIADHPEIERVLRRLPVRGKLNMIPYAADSVLDGTSPHLIPEQLRGADFSLIIARPEPENSILEMVAAWSMRPRGSTLAVLGTYSDQDPYQRSVKQAASPEVLFLGPIYDGLTVAALRSHATLYLYGHSVGGTSPTLVEALGAGTPVVALDTPYSRWVAAGAAMYFSTPDSCDRVLSDLLRDVKKREQMSEAARLQHQRLFTWNAVLHSYEQLLLSEGQ